MRTISPETSFNLSYGSFCHIWHWMVHWVKYVFNLIFLQSVYPDFTFKLCTVIRSNLVWFPKSGHFLNIVFTTACEVALLNSYNLTNFFYINFCCCNFVKFWRWVNNSCRSICAKFISETFEYEFWISFSGFFLLSMSARVLSSPLQWIMSNWWPCRSNIHLVSLAFNSLQVLRKVKALCSVIMVI